MHSTRRTGSLLSLRVCLNIEDAGDAMTMPKLAGWVANGRMFTTRDRDNDANESKNCARSSGWWFGKCSSSDVNKSTGIWTTGDPVYDLQASRMLLRYN